MTDLFKKIESLRTPKIKNCVMYSSGPEDCCIGGAVCYDEDGNEVYRIGGEEFVDVVRELMFFYGAELAKTSYFHQFMECMNVRCVFIDTDTMKSNIEVEGRIIEPYEEHTNNDNSNRKLTPLI